MTWTQRLSDIKGEGDHFEFFRSVFLGTRPAFPAGLDVWALDSTDPRYPSSPVLTSPTAFPTGDAGDPRRIADDSVRRLAWLGDLHYWIVLMLLDLSYRHNAATFSFAKDHMTDGLRVIGFALSDMGHGPAFDVLSMGYAPGLDRTGSIEVVRRLAKEAATRTDELAADGLLLSDYVTDLNPLVQAQLAIMDRHFGGDSAAEQVAFEELREIWPPMSVEQLDSAVDSRPFPPAVLVDPALQGGHRT